MLATREECQRLSSTCIRDPGENCIRIFLGVNLRNALDIIGRLWVPNFGAVLLNFIG